MLVATVILSFRVSHLVLMQGGWLVALPVLGLIVFIVGLSIFVKKKQKSNDQSFETWKTQAKKIKVSLLNYTIKSNSWVDEIEIKQDWKIQAFNQFTGNADKNIKKVARNPNYVQLILDLEGEPYHHQFTIDKDATTLKVLLELKQETWVYIDPNDPSKKYVDLDFLYR